jgi:hypothetical protein
MVKGLQPLIAEAGGYYPESPTIRYFEHPSIEALTNETITENIFVDVIVSCLEKKLKEDMWFEKRVNLWELAEPKDPYEILEKYGHPLQPDIDLLYGQCVNGKRQTPMVGVEVKLFSRFTGRGMKLAKTAGYEGYYAGLDEAISLLTLGLDFVYLWHVFVLPLTIWNKYLGKYGKKFAEKIEHETLSLGNLGFSLLGDMVIEPLEIPIGYFPTFLAIDPERKRFEVTHANFLEARPNYYSVFQDAERFHFMPSSRPRDLIVKALNLENVKVKEGIWECPHCFASLGSKTRYDYKYCPECGGKLETDSFYGFPVDKSAGE